MVILIERNSEERMIYQNLWVLWPAAEMNRDSQRQSLTKKELCIQKLYRFRVMVEFYH